jgi:dipeptidyl aminopeptidase/acylaminoacyl peptidase
MNDLDKSCKIEKMPVRRIPSPFCTILFIVFMLAFCVSQRGQARGPLTADDAVKMAKIGDVAMSPDGENAFYSIARLDWDKNKYVKTFYMTSSTGGEPRRFIGKDGGENFRFSPDGKRLSFLRKVEKENQIFAMRLSGGEAIQLTKHKGGIGNYRWSSDGSKIFFTARDIRGEKEEKEWKKGSDAYYVDEDANGKRAGLWRNLWVFDVKIKKETRLTEKRFIVSEFEVSPDGQKIVFAARPNARQNYPHLSELYLYQVGTKSLKRLTSNNAPERNLKWAPNGESFLYRSPDDKNFELRSGYFWVMDPETGKSRKLTAQNTGEVDHIVWTPDSKSILFNEVHGTNVNLYRLNVGNDQLTPLTNRTGTFRALAYSKDRKRIIYSFSDFTNPTDIYSANISSNNEVRITDSNSWLRKKIALGKGRVMRWKSTDGTEMEGIFVLPPNFKQGEKVPLIVDIHGGPSGYFGNEFDSFFQFYAGLGYAVLGVNVRGSSGYGDEILRGLMNDVGGGEFEDLMSGVDHLIKSGYIDGDKMGVRGWSWGGVSCGWVVTHTVRFKAASCGAGVFSWQAESGPGFNFDLSLWYIGGTAWTKPDEWRKHSALTYVKNAKTPTLLLHGSNDITSSTNQSMVFYTALRDLGIPTRFIKFPRQGHGIREPRLRRILFVEEAKWMQKYILGKEWHPPELNTKVP